MLFNSTSFAIFFAVVFVLWDRARHRTARCSSRPHSQSTASDVATQRRGAGPDNRLSS